jgi:type IV pilus secretin PilQ/predicted competence protein
MASLVGCSTRRGPEEPSLPPISEETVTIRTISYSEGQDYTRVTIEGSRPLVYESLVLLEDPLRISLEIPNASVEDVAPISVHDGTVTEIIAVGSEDGGTIDIGVTDRVDYNITQEANRLYIDIERVGEPSEPQPERPMAKKQIETLTAMRPANALTDVSVNKRDDITEVTLTADGIIGDYNAFTLESPPRLVIDLWKLKNLFSKNVVPAQTSQLRRVRIGSHPKKTRLVLDSSATTLAPYRIDRFQTELVVALGDVQALRQAVIGVLYGVDFKQIDDRSRVVLTSSKRVDYEIFKVSQRDVVIDLKKTMTPSHLARDLDTRAFDSAVEYIRLYNVRSETSKDVRVVIHLRETVDFEAFQEDERIFMDFQKPRKERVASNPEATWGVASKSTEPRVVLAGQEEQTAVNPEQVTVETAAVQPTTESQATDPGTTANSSGVAKEEMTPKEAVANPTREEATPQEKVEVSPPVQVTEPTRDVLGPVTPETGTPEPEAAAEDQPYYELGLTPGKRYTGRRLSLDFKDADIKNILRLIAEVSKLNIVAGDDVKGKVTIRLIDVPWDQALDIVLFSNNLGKMRMGNVIRVAPVEVLKKEEEEVLNAKRTKERLEDLVTELIPVNYSTASELQTQVKNILSERGSISVDTRTNTLVIKDIPKNITEARQLVETLDKETPQVIIEARIVEASTSFSRDLGIKWGGQAGLDSAGNPTIQIGGGRSTIGIKGGIGTNTVANFPVAGPTSAITFNLANLGDITNLDIELSALESAGEAEIISAPKITTLDNKEASIEQGLRIPYLKLTAEGTATTEFIEANIKLSVTPSVTSDGHIKMNIKASKDSPDDSITVQGVPAIDKKEAITEVLVKDGDIVVIAGIYTIEKGHRTERVPLLGKVPVLGWLFKRTEKDDDRRDLLIFISPKIVQQVA